jgi:hypothetical protein
MLKRFIMHLGIWWSPAKCVVYTLTLQFEEQVWFEFWKTPAFSKLSVLENATNLEELGLVGNENSSAL